MNSIRQPPDIKQAALLELSDERDLQLRLRLDAARAAYERGRRDERAELEAVWRAITRPVTRGIPYAELERRRWGPGGREHFADPRPGDFQGRKAAAA